MASSGGASGSWLAQSPRCILGTLVSAIKKQTPVPSVCAAGGVLAPAAPEEPFFAQQLRIALHCMRAGQFFRDREQKVLNWILAMDVNAYSHQLRLDCVEFLLLCYKVKLGATMTLVAFEAQRREQMGLMVRGWDLVRFKTTFGDNRSLTRAFRLRVLTILQHAGLLKTELACTEMASEVEVAAAFAAAPMLGRWAQTLQLARSLQSYGRNIADFHAKSLQSFDVLDYEVLHAFASLAVDAGEVQAPYPPVFAKYTVTVDKAVLSEFKWNSGPAEELKAAQARDGNNAQGSLAQNDTPRRLLRYGCVAQMLSWTGMAATLVGPASDRKVHLLGFVVVDDNNKQSEELQLSLEDSHWTGTYRILQVHGDDVTRLVYAVRAQIHLVAPTQCTDELAAVECVLHPLMVPDWLVADAQRSRADQMHDVQLQLCRRDWQFTQGRLLSVPPVPKALQRIVAKLHADRSDARENEAKWWMKELDALAEPASGRHADERRAAESVVRDFGGIKHLDLPSDRAGDTGSPTLLLFAEDDVKVPATQGQGSQLSHAQNTAMSMTARKQRWYLVHLLRSLPAEVYDDLDHHTASALGDVKGSILRLLALPERMAAANAKLLQQSDASAFPAYRRLTQLRQSFASLSAAVWDLHFRACAALHDAQMARRRAQLEVEAELFRQRVLERLSSRVRGAVVLEDLGPVDLLRIVPASVPTPSEPLQVAKFVREQTRGPACWGVSSQVASKSKIVLSRVSIDPDTMLERAWADLDGQVLRAQLVERVKALKIALCTMHRRVTMGQQVPLAVRHWLRTGVWGSVDPISRLGTPPQLEQLRTHVNELVHLQAELDGPQASPAAASLQVVVQSLEADMKDLDSQLEQVDVHEAKDSEQQAYLVHVRLLLAKLKGALPGALKAATRQKDTSAPPSAERADSKSSPLVQSLKALSSEVSLLSALFDDGHFSRATAAVDSIADQFLRVELSAIAAANREGIHPLPYFALDDMDNCSDNVSPSAPPPSVSPTDWPQEQRGLLLRKRATIARPSWRQRVNIPPFELPPSAHAPNVESCDVDGYSSLLAVFVAHLDRRESLKSLTRALTAVLQTHHKRQRCREQAIAVKEIATHIGSRAPAVPQAPNSAIRAQLRSALIRWQELKGMLTSTCPLSSKLLVLADMEVLVEGLPPVDVDASLVREREVFAKMQQELRLFRGTLASSTDYELSRCLVAPVLLAAPLKIRMASSVSHLPAKLSPNVDTAVEDACERADRVCSTFSTALARWQAVEDTELYVLVDMIEHKVRARMHELRVLQEREEMPRTIVEGALRVLSAVFNIWWVNCRRSRRSSDGQALRCQRLMETLLDEVNMAKQHADPDPIARTHVTQYQHFLQVIQSVSPPTEHQTPALWADAVRSEVAVAAKAAGNVGKHRPAPLDALALLERFTREAIYETDEEAQLNAARQSLLHFLTSGTNCDLTRPSELLQFAIETGKGLRRENCAMSEYLHQTYASLAEDTEAPQQQLPAVLAKLLAVSTEAAQSSLPIPLDERHRMAVHVDQCQRAHAQWLAAQDQLLKSISPLLAQVTPVQAAATPQVAPSVLPDLSDDDTGAEEHFRQFLSEKTAVPSHNKQLVAWVKESVVRRILSLASEQIRQAEMPVCSPAVTMPPTQLSVVQPLPSPKESAVQQGAADTEAVLSRMCASLLTELAQAAALAATPGTVDEHAEPTSSAPVSLDVDEPVTDNDAADDAEPVAGAAGGDTTADQEPAVASDPTDSQGIAGSSEDNQAGATPPPDTDDQSIVPHKEQQADDQGPGAEDSKTDNSVDKADASAAAAIHESQRVLAASIHDALGRTRMHQRDSVAGAPVLAKQLVEGLVRAVGDALSSVGVGAGSHAQLVDYCIENSLVDRLWRKGKAFGTELHNIFADVAIRFRSQPSFVASRKGNSAARALRDASDDFKAVYDEYGQSDAIVPASLDNNKGGADELVVVRGANVEEAVDALRKGTLDSITGDVKLSTTTADEPNKPATSESKTPAAASNRDHPQRIRLPSDACADAVLSSFELPEVIRYRQLDWAELDTAEMQRMDYVAKQQRGLALAAMEADQKASVGQDDDADSKETAETLESGTPKFPRKLRDLMVDWSALARLAGIRPKWDLLFVNLAKEHAAAHAKDSGAGKISDVLRLYFRVRGKDPNPAITLEQKPNIRSCLRSVGDSIRHSEKQAARRSLPVATIEEEQEATPTDATGTLLDRLTQMASDVDLDEISGYSKLMSWQRRVSKLMKDVEEASEQAVGNQIQKLASEFELLYTEKQTVVLPAIASFINERTQRLRFFASSVADELEASASRHGAPSMSAQVDWQSVMQQVLSEVPADPSLSPVRPDLNHAFRVVSRTREQILASVRRVHRHFFWRNAHTPQVDRRTMLHTVCCELAAYRAVAEEAKSSVISAVLQGSQGKARHAQLGRRRRQAEYEQQLEQKAKLMYVALSRTRRLHDSYSEARLWAGRNALLQLVGRLDARSQRVVLSSSTVARAFLANMEADPHVQHWGFLWRTFGDDLVQWERKHRAVFEAKTDVARPVADVCEPPLHVVRLLTTQNRINRAYYRDLGREVRSMSQVARSMTRVETWADFLAHLLIAHRALRACKGDWHSFNSMMTRLFAAPSLPVVRSSRWFRYGRCERVSPTLYRAVCQQATRELKEASEEFHEWDVLLAVILLWRTAFAPTHAEREATDALLAAWRDQTSPSWVDEPSQPSFKYVYDRPALLTDVDPSASATSPSQQGTPVDDLAESWKHTSDEVLRAIDEVVDACVPQPSPRETQELQADWTVLHQLGLILWRVAPPDAGTDKSALLRHLFGTDGSAADEYRFSPLRAIQESSAPTSS